MKPHVQQGIISYTARFLFNLIDTASIGSVRLPLTTRTPHLMPDCLYPGILLVLALPTHLAKAAEVRPYSKDEF